MLPVLSIRLSDTQMESLSSVAKENSTTISNIVISKLFPDYNTGNNLSNELSIPDVLKRVKKLESGSLFSIPELFSQPESEHSTYPEWKKYTNTISIGRTFRIASKDQDSAVSELVDFVEKKSGESAVYRRK